MAIKGVSSSIVGHSMRATSLGRIISTSDAACRAGSDLSARYFNSIARRSSFARLAIGPYLLSLTNNPLEERLCIDRDGSSHCSQPVNEKWKFGGKALQSS